MESSHSRTNLTLATDGNRDVPPLDKAERLFARVFMNLTRRQTDIITFRRLADLGKPIAIETVHTEQLDLAQEILTNPAYDEFYKDRKAAVEFLGGPAKMAAATASQEIRKYSQIIDAASLVFLHSAVDAAVSDLCRVTALLRPADWEPYIRAMKVTVSDAKSLGIDTVIAQKLGAHLDALEKESILKRIERLFALCKPDKGFAPIGGGFVFDLERVERIDKRRHELVHGQGYKSLDTFHDTDLEFLVKTGLFVWAMVSKRYDVKMNPLHALGIGSPGPPPVDS